MCCPARGTSRCTPKRCPSISSGRAGSRVFWPLRSPSVTVTVSRPPLAARCGSSKSCSGSGDRRKRQAGLLELVHQLLLGVLEKGRLDDRQDPLLVGHAVVVGVEAAVVGELASDRTPRRASSTACRSPRRRTPARRRPCRTPGRSPRPRRAPASARPPCRSPRTAPCAARRGTPCSRRARRRHTGRGRSRGAGTEPR